MQFYALSELLDRSQQKSSDVHTSRFAITNPPLALVGTKHTDFLNFFQNSERTNSMVIISSLKMLQK